MLHFVFCLYFQCSRYSSVNSFVRRRFLLFDTSCSFSFVQTYLANNFKHIYAFAYTFTWITWWSFQISFVLYYILCIKITKRKFDATKYFIHCIPLSHISILLILKWDKRKCLSEQRTIAFFLRSTLIFIALHFFFRNSSMNFFFSSTMHSQIFLDSISIERCRMIFFVISTQQKEMNIEQKKKKEKISCIVKRWMIITLN